MVSWLGFWITRFMSEEPAREQCSAVYSLIYISMNRQCNALTQRSALVHSIIMTLMLKYIYAILAVQDGPSIRKHITDKQHSMNSE